MALKERARRGWRIIEGLDKALRQQLGAGDDKQGSLGGWLSGGLE